MKSRFTRFLFYSLVGLVFTFFLTYAGSNFGKQDRGCMSKSETEGVNFVEKAKGISDPLDIESLVYFEDPYECYQKCMDECGSNTFCSEVCARKCGFY